MEFLRGILGLSNQPEENRDDSETEEVPTTGPDTAMADEAEVEPDTDTAVADEAEVEPDTAVADEVPQSKPLPRQVPNSAGGFSWQVDDMKRLKRFLCLGSEKGTYYIGEKKLGKENAEAILRLIAAGRGQEVVGEIVTFSVEGRAAKQNPIIFALALCARDKDVETKRAAYAALGRVCRIPTHLFTFIEFCESLSVGTGWGRAHRTAVQQWYNSKTPKSLAMAVTKYRQRGGWSHLDVLRLAHVKPVNPGVACVCKYIVKGMDECRTEFAGQNAEIDETLAFLEVVEAAKTADKATVIGFIRENGLVREHIPTNHLSSQHVSTLSLWIAAKYSI